MYSSVLDSLINYDIMEIYIFIAGVLITALFLIGIWMSHKERVKNLKERQDLKKNRNEYRTNEEFISFP